MGDNGDAVETEGLGSGQGTRPPSVDAQWIDEQPVQEGVEFQGAEAGAGVDGVIAVHDDVQLGSSLIFH